MVRSSDIVLQVNITLEDFYKGCTKEVTFDKQTVFALQYYCGKGKTTSGGRLLGGGFSSTSSLFASDPLVSSLKPLPAAECCLSFEDAVGVVVVVGSPCMI